MSQIEKLITKEQAANLVPKSTGTIDNWVKKGVMPQPKKIGHCVYWHPEAFRQWLDHEFGLTQSNTLLLNLPYLSPEEGHATALR